MTAVVVPLCRRSPSSQLWSNQEIAEFYRVTELLSQAGLAVSLDSGVTDEGDPWQVFYREDTGDVIAHFARINGQFVVACPPTGDVQRGTNLRDMVASMMRSQPLFTATAGRSKGNVYLHPGMVLSAFVALAYMLAVDASEARAAETSKEGSDTASASKPIVATNQDRTTASDGAAEGWVDKTLPASARKVENSVLAERYAVTMIAVVTAAAYVLNAPDAAAEWVTEAVTPEPPSLARPAGSVAADTMPSHPDTFSFIDALKTGHQRPATSSELSESDRMDMLNAPLPLSAADILCRSEAVVMLRDGLDAAQTFVVLSQTTQGANALDALVLRNVYADARALDTVSATSSELNLTIPLAPITIKIPDDGTVLVIVLERLKLSVGSIHNAIEVHVQLQAPQLADDAVKVAAPVAQPNADSPAPQETSSAASPASSPSAPAPASPPAETKLSADPVMVKMDTAHNAAALQKGAELVLYSGGAVTLYNFELGVDKLVIDAGKVDAAHLSAKWLPDNELVMDFGHGMTIKMVGIISAPPL